MDPTEKDGFEKSIGQWLDEPTSNPENDDIPIREYHGSPHWYEEEVKPEDEILKEHPSTTRRRHDREFSEQWGWLWDLMEYICELWTEKIWTTSFMINLGYISYGLLMVGLVWAAGYYSFSNPVQRTIPTIEEILKDPPEEDELYEGSSTTSEMSNDKSQ